jgi:hypothetical protein
MIEFKTGDILAEDAEALVNTVNCVGIMGRGVALRFKRAFPENFKAYERACRQGQVDTGHWLCSADMYPVEITASVLGSQYVLYFILSEPFVRLMVDRETARIDALIAKVREALDRLKELRTALIFAAVTGKIDVREHAA